MLRPHGGQPNTPRLPSIPVSSLQPDLIVVGSDSSASPWPSGSPASWAGGSRCRHHIGGNTYSETEPKTGIEVHRRHLPLVAEAGGDELNVDLLG